MLTGSVLAARGGRVTDHWGRPVGPVRLRVLDLCSLGHDQYWLLVGVDSLTTEDVQ